MAGQNAAPLLKVEGLKQYFRVSKSYTVKAVDNVSFEIYPGETYGLVGESGSGKSTIGRSIIRLYDPTQMQMIFQDPMASLNPRKKVEDIIGEGLDIHHMYKTREERREKVEKILAKVGLAPEHAERYPHQFSGGQRQRVGIARAYCNEPKVLFLDEPFGHLDAQTRYLMQEEIMRIWDQEKRTVLFVTNNIEEAIYLADRIIVLSNCPTHIKAEYVIDLPRPRNLVDPEFLRLRSEITVLLDKNME